MQSLIAIQTLHHVSLVVQDLARAKAFYGPLLGLRELSRPPFPFEGAWYAVGDCQLHLTVHAPARTLRGTSQIDSRDGHIAVRVRDYGETLAYLRSRGVPVKESYDNVTPWAQLYITDPDGNVIELNAERR
jgi:catechol 2,3-dioxygenase-like lactoylglutathione lyase family enzyme